MHGRAVPSHVRDGVGAPLTPRCMVEAGLEVRCRAHVAVSDEGAVTDSRILRNALEASNNAQMRDGLHLLGRFTQSSMSDNGSYRTMRVILAAWSVLPTVVGECCRPSVEHMARPTLGHSGQLKLRTARCAGHAVG